MTLRSQLYLLQLEEYNLNRWLDWQEKNPNREVREKKGKIRWTAKARIVYFLAKIFGIPLAVKILSPADTLLKLLLVALAKIKLLLLHHRLIVIGITGSWGKTTTKEKLAAILATKYRVYKTAGNNNTLAGVALNIIKMPKSAELFVCEMAAYKKGDIKAICNLVKPKIGIITVIGPMHLERFGNLETIRKTKSELFESLPKDGLKINPGEDLVKKIIDYFHLDSSRATSVLSSISPPPHRLELTQSNDLTIIDDTYNSNPEGFRLALKKLAETSGRPKILVTPGMIELGSLQFIENQKAGKAAKRICDIIILVGETNRPALLSGIGRSNKVYLASDIEEAKEILSRKTKPGAVVLLENDLPDHYF